MLEVRGLVKHFGARAAVNDVTFRVEPGQVVALLGENGAGKTTTLRCVASILQPTAGSITVGGHDLKRDAAAARRAMAYIPEVPHPYEMLTVWEHLLFITTAYNRPLQPERGRALLRRLEMDDQRDILAGRLSKGMRQKLACIGALVHQPDVYLFDEPLIGLDPQGGRELRNLIAEERERGAAVLICTHMLEVAAQISDRIIVMHRGRIAAQGSLDELRLASQAPAGSGLEEIYFRLAGPGAPDV